MINKNNYINFFAFVLILISFAVWVVVFHGVLDNTRSLDNIPEPILLIVLIITLLLWIERGDPLYDEIDGSVYKDNTIKMLGIAVLGISIIIMIFAELVFNIGYIIVSSISCAIAILCISYGWYQESKVTK